MVLPLKGVGVGVVERGYDDGGGHGDEAGANESVF